MSRVFAVADLHGMKELYEQIVEFLNPDDKVYYLGDMGDRGTDCWETVKLILDNPQFECLMGNHEDMLLNTMQTWIHIPEDEKELVWHTKTGQLLAHNGGYNTLDGWTKEPAEIRSKYYIKIKNLPTHFEYKNKDNKWIYMSHAGFTPYDYEEFPDKESLIWDRNHFMYGWPHDAPNDIIILHGHTPIPYLVDDTHLFARNSYKYPQLPCAYWYNDNHKCCIDNGAFYYKCTVLLNLDTFEEHKFFAEGYNEKIARGENEYEEEDEDKWEEELDLLNLMISGV